MIDLFPL